jgi:hypothetical protein
MPEQTYSQGTIQESGKYFLSLVLYSRMKSWFSLHLFVLLSTQTAHSHSLGHPRAKGDTLVASC